jgi:hypothetical protein
VEWFNEHHHGKPIHWVSSRTEEGLDALFHSLLSQQSQPNYLIEVDYSRYGIGEAMMGWFNGRVGIHSKGPPLDCGRLLLKLATEIQCDLEADSVELAHFKMSMSRTGGEMTVVNAVRNGQPAVLSRRSPEKLFAAELLINLRGEADPYHLDRCVTYQLDRPRKDWNVIWKQKAAFRPGQPQPTHRVTELLT